MRRGCQGAIQEEDSQGLRLTGRLLGSCGYSITLFFPQRCVLIMHYPDAV